MTSTQDKVPTSSSVKVVCRFRPLNSSEIRSNSRVAVQFHEGCDENSVSIQVSHVRCMGSRAYYMYEN